MFSYSCPACAQKLLAPPERAGQRTICPKCLKPLTIPSPVRADDDDGDPHDGLFHAGPLVDDESPTHPTGVPQPATVAAQAADPDPEVDFSPAVQLLPEPPTARLPELQPPPSPRPRPAPQPSSGRGKPPAPPSARSKPAAPPPRPEPATPPPARQPARLATAVPTRLHPAADQAGRIVFNPTGMAGVDLAADLAADLTLRMKPPPEPAADLMLTTLAWLGLTALAAVLWVAGVLYEPGTLPFVALIGGLLVAVGYLWGLYSARSGVGLLATAVAAGVVGGGLVWVVQRQVNTAWSELPSNFVPAMLLPVVSALFALPVGVLRFRPLRYVLTGELLVLLFVVSPAARAGVQKAIDRLQPTPAVTAPLPATPGEKVRQLADLKSPDRLLTTLADLAEPDADNGASPEARAELAAELAKRAGPAEGRAEVRAAALAALAVWQPDAIRGPVLMALRSADAGDRRLGLALAGRWADPEVAAAVAARLNDRMDAAAAQKALRQIGGRPAEAVLLPLLKTEDRGAALLVVMELLEAVGGPDALAGLRQVEKTATSPNVRDEAKLRADAIQARLKK